MWTSEFAGKRLFWAYVSRCWKPEGEWLKAIQNVCLKLLITVRKGMKTELVNHFLCFHSYIYSFESLNAVNHLPSLWKILTTSFNLEYSGKSKSVFHAWVIYGSRRAFYMVLFLDDIFQCIWAHENQIHWYLHRIHVPWLLSYS